MRTFKHPVPPDFILERLLYALSDPVRFEIVRYLAGVTEASCGELDGGRPKSSKPGKRRLSSWERSEFMCVVPTFRV